MDQHLHPLELARLTEGHASEQVRERSARHLARCRQCVALYAELARSHLDPARMRPAADEWVQLGLRVSDSRRPAEPVELRSRRRRSRALVLVWAALAGLAVLAGGLILTRSRHADPPGVPAATRAVLAQLVREDSYRNLLYSAELLPEARGTRGNSGSSIDSHLRELRRLSRRHPDDADVLFWLVSGSLAASQLRDSGTYLADALRTFPQDPRFKNLAGILAFKRDDLQGAESHLRAAALRDRTGVAKFNLVRVLTQLGRAPEAERLADELRKEHPRLARAADLDR